MLNEKLKELRKASGLSQEELAARLNVVRQTVSKWEKGLSVPDADMLIKISEILDISVSELLGAESPSPIENGENRNDIAIQLSIINEQLALKNQRSRRFVKILLWVLLGFIVFCVLASIIMAFSFLVYHTDPQTAITAQSETALFSSIG